MACVFGAPTTNPLHLRMCVRMQCPISMRMCDRLSGWGALRAAPSAGDGELTIPKHGLGPEKVTYVYVHAFSERASTNKGGWVGVVCAPRWERARE